MWNGEGKKWLYNDDGQNGFWRQIAPNQMHIKLLFAVVWNLMWKKAHTKCLLKHIGIRVVDREKHSWFALSTL